MARAQPRHSDSWAFARGDEIVPGRHAVRRLGGGRRYEAYLATDDELLMTVVVKILRPSRVEDPSSIEGLWGELRALRSLSHPVIVRAFGANIEGPRPHVVLEFLEGPRLSTLLRRHGPLAPEQLVPLALQICAGLHYMHRRQTVHLDVKPQNIIMSAPPRLIDLSISRSIDAARRLTVAIGTDAYMAPEQFAPADGLVGPPADVWAVGVTLYEALTGRRLFTGTSEQPDPQRAIAATRALEDVPGPLRHVLQACIEPDPRARPTAREVSEALEPFVAAMPRRLVLSRMRPGWR